MNKRAIIQDFLYTSVKRGNWEGVIKTYGEEPEAQWLKLTQAGDTALHLAAYDKQEEVVASLVKLICRSQNYKRVLEIKNERGCNPFHVAAAMGSPRMCHAIASAIELLVDERNKDGETPLFLAALHGHKKAFFCLYHFCGFDLTRVRTNCRRKNGDTVLHCVLKNQQFDLAFELINMNKDAANWVDENGFTPLHVLATQPTAFKSGSHIARWQLIIYYCIYVDRLKPESAPTRRQEGKTTSKPKTKTAASFPDNYVTCIAFLTNLWERFLTICTLKRASKKKENLNPSNDEAKDTDLETDVGEGIQEIDSDKDIQLLKPDRDQSESKSSIALYLQNYDACINFFQFFFSAIMIAVGFGSAAIRKIREKKQRNTWSVQVMEKLVELAKPDKYRDDGNTPMISKLQTQDEFETLPYTVDGDSIGFNKKENLTHPNKMPNSNVGAEKRQKKRVSPKETAMLLAAKHGVVEMVSRLFERFPLAIRDINPEKKNVVLLAAEYKQPEVYMFLLKKKNEIESLFRAVDLNGNSALHLAAHARAHKTWRITGAALQMQWDLKWYQFVRDSMPRQFFVQYNNEGKLAKNIFYETHKKLIKSGEEWLTHTSLSCFLLAALVVKVAVASATTFPGGYGQDGTPRFQKEKAFFIFPLSSLIALSLSSTSLIMFLAILTSRFNQKDFGSNLPGKLLVGLSSLFFSVVAMLVSFCAGHNFLLSYRLRNMAVVIFIITSVLLALIFAKVQLPLYYDLLFAILSKVPKRIPEVIVSDN